MLVDLYLVYSFIKRLATPFNEWDAYKLGIIDEDGKILKSRKDLKLIKERDAFGLFDVMILNLKRLIEKLPAGKTRLASYAAALYLIKEGNNYRENMPDHVLEESFLNHFQSLSENDLNLQFEEMVNTAGGGSIGGLPPDDPPVVNPKILRRKKKKVVQ
jgi:hypothetical protein